MGMGFGALLLGNIADWLIGLAGLAVTFRIFALVLLVVLLLGSFLSKNAPKSHSDLIIDCIKVFSSIFPKTRPKIVGATGKPCLIIKNAKTPKPNIAITSK